MGSPRPLGEGLGVRAYNFCQSTNRQAFEELLPQFTQAYERSLFDPLVSRQRPPDRNA
ncbi:MAG: hypothetical protein LVT47_04405 [Cyanobacteria bacterium LVE1205-1]|jgi:hypothetical protein